MCARVCGDGGLVAKLCLTLCHPMDCSLATPGSVHGISQVRMLEWGSTEDLPDPGIKPRSPALQGDSLLTEPPGKPIYLYMCVCMGFFSFFFFFRHFISQFFLSIFIYLWLYWVFVAASKLYRIEMSGATLHCGARASHYAGSYLEGLWAGRLQHAGSVAVALGLQMEGGRRGREGKERKIRAHLSLPRTSRPRSPPSPCYQS